MTYDYTLFLKIMLVWAVIAIYWQHCYNKEQRERREFMVRLRKEMAAQHIANQEAKAKAKREARARRRARRKARLRAKKAAALSATEQPSHNEHNPV